MGLKNLCYGDRIVEDIETMLPRSFAVVTAPEPWMVVEQRLKGKDYQVVEVAGMDEHVVSDLERTVYPVEAVLGVGGGAAMDMAKYISWKRRIPLFLLPSIASVDAAVTTSIAVRVEGKVRYIGEAVSEVVGIDFPLIRSAPIHLNRAGVGDILSIHTALWDWKLASDRVNERYSKDFASIVASMPLKMDEKARDLRDVTDDGIRLLFDLYNEETDVLERWGNSRPEEGSEHFFAYALEYLTGQEFVHGELVCLGVYVSSHIQGNRSEWVYDFINKVGVRFRLTELDISSESFRKCLLTLEDYCEAEGFFYTVINERRIDDQLVDDIMEKLDII